MVHLKSLLFRALSCLLTWSVPSGLGKIPWRTLHKSRASWRCSQSCSQQRKLQPNEMNVNNFFLWSRRGGTPLDTLTKHSTAADPQQQLSNIPSAYQANRRRERMGDSLQELREAVPVLDVVRPVGQELQLVALMVVEYSPTGHAVHVPLV